jgi:hypothetical protein
MAGIVPAIAFFVRREETNDEMPEGNPMGTT